MINVRLFSRENCHLCDQVLEWLFEIQKEQIFNLEIIDINKNAKAQKEWGAVIPVVEIDDLIFKYPFSKTDLKVAILATAITHDNHNPSGGTIFKILNLIDEHWLSVANGFFSFFLFGAFLPPILMSWGMEKAAKWGYSLYGFFCHQFGFRSFYLFGYQFVYPRELAEVSGLEAFGFVTGLDEFDLFAARKHIGDSIMGFKVALCERDIAMYAGLVVFGLLFVALRNKLRGLPLWAWLVFALIPISLDGGLQLISQLPIDGMNQVVEMRESTPLLRTATGFIFGFGTAWFTYPLIQASIRVGK